MLLRQQVLLLAILGLSATTTRAFSVMGRPVAINARAASTCRQAVEEENSSQPASDSGAADADGATASANNGGADILNSPAFLQRKLEVLKSDIAKVEEEMEVAKQQLAEGKEEWGPQLEELQKEYKNIQERMSVQSKGGDTMATVQVAREMLSVLDNYDRAFGAVTPETEEEVAIEADYKATYQEILNTFAELGVEEVETVGCEFDYEVHQAVMQKPSDEYEEGLVCEELQKGFKIGDTLVRAAMVVVAV